MFRSCESARSGASVFSGREGEGTKREKKRREEEGGLV